MGRILGILVVAMMVGCGGASTQGPSPEVNPTPPAPAATTPQSLEEGMRAQGLTPIELASVRREMTHSFGDPGRQEGNRLVFVETGGWSASPSIFARGADGTIFRVSPQPNTIVDRHVQGGCLTFAGGRGWFEEVEYQLPDGATYGGEVTVAYDHHVEITDHSDREPDGSPCPRPAID